MKLAREYSAVERIECEPIKIEKAEAIAGTRR
jgi:hypothetical protein